MTSTLQMKSAESAIKVAGGRWNQVLAEDQYRLHITSKDKYVHIRTEIR